VWSIDSVTAGIGTKVTWKWADSLHVHNLAVDGYFQADNPTKQGTRTVTFETKGTFYFTCAAHPDTMWGVVEIR
jgi:plastocyanin